MLQQHIMSLPWNKLFEMASEQKGYFLTQQANELGISSPSLNQQKNRGYIESVFHGIYRFSQFPISNNEDLMVIWLWSKGEGIFSNETALLHHQLSDVLPRKIHITLPPSHSRQRKPPKGVIPYYDDVPDDDITWHGELPFTSPERTLRDLAKKKFDQELIEQAIKKTLLNDILTFQKVAEIIAILYGLIPKEPKILKGKHNAK